MSFHSYVLFLSLCPTVCYPSVTSHFGAWGSWRLKLSFFFFFKAFFIAYRSCRWTAQGCTAFSFTCSFCCFRWFRELLWWYFTKARCKEDKPQFYFLLNSMLSVMVTQNTFNKFLSFKCVFKVSAGFSISQIQGGVVHGKGITEK